MNHRYSILIDGGFFVRKLYTRLRRRPEVDDVIETVRSIQKKFDGYDLLRIYYYDAKPATGKLTNPISGVETNLATTDVFRRNQSFLDKLELSENVALRLGETSANGWKLKRSALEDPEIRTRCLTQDDLVMDIEQKGVDLRIGLDIARLSLVFRV